MYHYEYYPDYASLLKRKYGKKVRRKQPVSANTYMDGIGCSKHGNCFTCPFYDENEPEKYDCQFGAKDDKKFISNQNSTFSRRLGKAL